MPNDGKSYDCRLDAVMDSIKLDTDNVSEQQIFILSSSMSVWSFLWH